MGWATIAVVVCSPLLFVATVFATRRWQQRSGDTHAPSSGGLLGFDEVFQPSAHDARMAWEAQQEIPAPAPTPDKGPGVIEASARITIEIDDAPGSTQFFRSA